METNEKLGKILQLCLELQASGWGDVFYSQSGHVGKINVYGYKGGFREDGSSDFDFYTYYIDSEMNDFVSDSSKLDEIVSYLKIQLP